MQALENPPHWRPPAPVRLPLAKKHIDTWSRRTRGPGKNVQMHYTRNEVSPVEVHGFIGPEGQPTFHPERHLHVIHKEDSKKVVVVMTDRTQTDKRMQHPLEITSRYEPSGQDVNDAIGAMLAVMNSVPRGPGRVEL
jgi:hypothetical protein